MKKILIIEDHTALCEEIRSWFTFEGFKTFIAPNGFDGVQIALKELPDIILCDIMLPEMDGNEVLSAIRSHKDTQLIPFIFMTALAERKNIRDGMELGADDYIVKPFTQEEVIKSVNIRLHKTLLIRDHAELETYERTRELQSANKELDSFSYSISHDLRSPLRAINGFANMILEDYTDLFDSEGKRKMQVIIDSANKMGRLIDDLLAFSRVSEYEMNKSTLNMKSMAESVFFDLCQESSIEDIVFTIHDIPEAYGDPSMIRQIWVNLISNAIKFTSKKPNRIIEIGCNPGLSESVYWVKDNGAGFDMEYAKNMFGVFKRMHSTKEFDGTGVGLAIVKRIAQRHKGKVMAEGVLNEGARVSFSLPVRK